LKCDFLNLAGNSDEEGYDKHFDIAFSPKSEQLEVIFIVVTGKDMFVEATT